MFRILGGVQKVRAKKVRAHFPFTNAPGQWKARSLDGPIRANRFGDSRELGDSRESLQGSRTEPLFLCESRFGVPKIANRREGQSHNDLGKIALSNARYRETISAM